MSRRGSLATALTVSLAGLLLAGCFTGKRPSFSDEPFPTGAMTGDVATDAVLARFDAATTGPATVTYSVLTKFGNVTAPAAVVLDAGSRSVTIGNVRYIETVGTAATCTEDNSLPCATGLDATRISDKGITIDFYAAEAAIRLRRDFNSKIAPPAAHTELIAEQNATCVDISLSAGVAVYCALDSGLLAKLDDGSVLITVTSFGPVADASRFSIPA